MREREKPVESLLPVGNLGFLIGFGGGFPSRPIRGQYCPLSREGRGDVRCFAGSAIARLAPEARRRLSLRPR